MNEKKEQLILDQAGYNQILLEIDELKKQLAKNNLEKVEAYSGTIGDGWHDNFAFEEANRQERLILRRIKEKYCTLQNAVIIESKQNSDLADLGDIVSVKINDADEFEFKLVSVMKSFKCNEEGLIEISINSPLGKSVYQKAMGERTGYTVDSKKFFVEIQKIIKASSLENRKNKTK